MVALKQVSVASVSGLRGWSHFRHNRDLLTVGEDAAEGAAVLPLVVRRAWQGGRQSSRNPLAAFLGGRPQQVLIRARLALLNVGLKCSDRAIPHGAPRLVASTPFALTLPTGHYDSAATNCSTPKPIEVGESE